MEGFSQGCGRAVRVLGIGHLAAAVRLELARRGLRVDSDLDAERVFLACSDFENPASLKEVVRLASEGHDAVLFACLTQVVQPPRTWVHQNAIKVVDHVVQWLAKAQ